MGKRDQESVFRMAINTPIQGTAADLIKVAMIRIESALEREKLSSRMIMQVHDEIVLEVAPGEQVRAETLVREGMEHAAEFRVPLLVDLRTAANWSEAH
jgi:DNA polymerase-1